MNDSKTRILFVDDEPLVLSGLQRMLRPLHQQWDMAFVESGSIALEQMARNPYDVIVSDMRMPVMNGAQLFDELSRRYPKTVRIILSGHADKNLIIQCVSTAHQFLAKPCEPDALKAAIARAHSFENSIKSAVLKELIAKMRTLPSVPSLFHEIAQKVRDEDCSMEEVGAIIARDAGMSAKLLKLVNSAFFGLCRPISSPVEAVTYLGIDTIKALVLAANAFGSYEDKPNNPLNVESVWNHSLQIGNWCRNIAQHENSSRSETDECFIAGLLHDVGKLALSVNAPVLYVQAVDLARAEGMPIHVAEEQVFGANHADVGGCLLSLWGLPPRVVDAIASHHDPRSCVTEAFSPLAAVHAAEAFESECNENRLGAPVACDSDFFQEHGLTDRLEQWKSLKP
ncbi:MAG TPA: response regulator [Verrucomicrobiae bacterium]|nr:response regulator [Verrucomicrobiae bacterium]